MAKPVGTRARAPGSMVSEAEVSAAVAFAEESPPPEPAILLDDVYTEVGP